MSNVGTGYSFGTTEEVTAAKLLTMMTSATVTSIVNADIDSNAAIADTKLAQISTASKVSGAAITLLSSVPGAAGALPIANGGTGQTTLAGVMNLVYPVGSVYLNATDSTNPGTLLGFGTWVSHTAIGSNYTWKRTV